MQQLPFEYLTDIHVQLKRWERNEGKAQEEKKKAKMEMTAL